jgi:hypothetical protein
VATLAAKKNNSGFLHVGVMAPSIENFDGNKIKEVQALGGIHKEDIEHEWLQP